MTQKVSKLKRYWYRHVSDTPAPNRRARPALTPHLLERDALFLGDEIVFARMYRLGSSRGLDALLQVEEVQRGARNTMAQRRYSSTAHPPRPPAR